MIKSRVRPNGRSLWLMGLVVAGLVGNDGTAYALTPKEIYQQVGPGVVLILASDDGRLGNGGTGSIIREDGWVVTNAHVVISKETGRPYRRLSLFLKPARVTGVMEKDLMDRHEARLMAYDEPLDLALLRMETPPRGVTVIGLADPAAVSIGEPVVAIGHPETGGLWTLTTGTISAEIEDFNGIRGKHIFQTETSLNRGNSGGPLLNEQGAMVGVNSLISRKAADGLTITAINFALKSGVARQWLAAQGLEIPYAAGPPSSADRPVQELNRPPSGPHVSGENKGEPPVPTPRASNPSPGETARSAPPPPARPQTLTEVRPYDLDRLISDRMREMEDLMDEMRRKLR